MWFSVHVALTLFCVGSAVGSWLAARRAEDQTAQAAARHDALMTALVGTAADGAERRDRARAAAARADLN